MQNTKVDFINFFNFPCTSLKENDSSDVLFIGIGLLVIKGDCVQAKLDELEKVIAYCLENISAVYTSLSEKKIWPLLHEQDHYPV